MRRLCGIDANSNILSFWLLCALAITVCSPAIAHDIEHPFSSDKDEYVFGVFPYLAPRQIETIYAPITAALTEALGRHVHLTSGLSYTKFMDSVQEELYDIVFVQPFDYVSIADAHGYVPLATRDEPLPAILVVREDSPVKTLSDLQNKIIALPPKVAAVSRLVTDHLIKVGIDFDLKTQLQYQKSHFACMHQVIVGQADACGTAPPALRFFQQKTDAKLRIVSKTLAIPNSLFAAHPRVTPQERQKIIDTMLSWSNTEQGRKLLEKAKVNAFVPIGDRDYDLVRRMSRKPMPAKSM
jgi:phosphonate transport system substrate-binding protein